MAARGGAGIVTGVARNAFGVVRIAGRDVDLVFILLLAVALAYRLYLATNVAYIHDEENNAIPLAGTISFTPGSVHLPLRGENHGALPAYAVKVSSLLFGTEPLGYRAVHVGLGLGAVVLIYLLARTWQGVAVARWAAALVAFNDYFLPISSRATAHAPFLCLVALSLYAFSRFLVTQRAGFLYGAGAAAGLAFYCKEHAALLLPVFFLTLLHPRLRHWLRGRHAYLAAAVFGAFLAPDVYWNATASGAGVTYGDQVALQADYGSHLSRVGGVGFSPYPLMFYGRRVVMPVYQTLTGRELVDETPEYSSINPVLGAVLLGSVVGATLLLGCADLTGVSLLLMFWCIFGLFTVIERGNPPGRLDPVSWIWVEATLFPAALLTGALLVRTGGWMRYLAWAVAGGALVLAVFQVFQSAVG